MMCYNNKQSMVKHRERKQLSVTSSISSHPLQGVPHEQHLRHPVQHLRQVQRRGSSEQRCHHLPRRSDGRPDVRHGDLAAPAAGDRRRRNGLQRLTQPGAVLGGPASRRAGCLRVQPRAGSRCPRDLREAPEAHRRGRRPVGLPDPATPRVIRRLSEAPRSAGLHFVCI